MCGMCNTVCCVHIGLGNTLFYIIVCLSLVICHQGCGLRLMTFCRLREAHCAIIRILLAACRHATFAKLHWRLNESEEGWVLGKSGYRNPAVTTWQCIVSPFVLHFPPACFSLNLSLVLFLLLVRSRRRRHAIWLLHHITDSLCKALNSAREPKQLLTRRARPSLSPAATQPRPVITRFALFVETPLARLSWFFIRLL